MVTEEQLQYDKSLKAITSLLKATPETVFSRFTNLLETGNKNENELIQLRKQLSTLSGTNTGSIPSNMHIEKINGVNFYSKIVMGIPLNQIKSLAEEARKQIESGIIAIVAVSEDKRAGLVVTIKYPKN